MTKQLLSFIKFRFFRSSHHTSELVTQKEPWHKTKAPAFGVNVCCLEQVEQTQ